MKVQSEICRAIFFIVAACLIASCGENEQGNREIANDSREPIIEHLNDTIEYKVTWSDTLIEIDTSFFINTDKFPIDFKDIEIATLRRIDSTYWNKHLSKIPCLSYRNDFNQYIVDEGNRYYAYQFYKTNSNYYFFIVGDVFQSSYLEYNAIIVANKSLKPLYMVDVSFSYGTGGDPNWFVESFDITSNKIFMLFKYNDDGYMKNDSIQLSIGHDNIKNLAFYYEINHLTSVLD